jgi:hypothetical protein
VSGEGRGAAGLKSSRSRHGRRSNRVGEEEQGDDCCWGESRYRTSGVGEGRGRGSSIGKVGGGGAAGKGRGGMIAAGVVVDAAQVGWGRGGGGGG